MTHDQGLKLSSLLLKRRCRLLPHQVLGITSCPGICVCCYSIWVFAAGYLRRGLEWSFQCNCIFQKKPPVYRAGKKLIKIYAP